MADINITANGSSSSPTISDEGAFLAFGSNATNLSGAQSDANGTTDAFLYQRMADPFAAADFDGDGFTDSPSSDPPAATGSPRTA